MKTLPDFSYSPHAESPLQNRMDDYCYAFIRRMHQLAESASTKEVDALTDDEKFSLAMAVGVPIHWVQDENGRTVRCVTDKCGIYKYDGKFHVITDRSEDEKLRGERMTIPLP